jgi:DNA polymerase III alpha subunit
MLNGMSKAHAEAIVAARGGGPFVSMDDFARRTRLGRGVLTRLAKAGAFASLELHRRHALWDALAQDKKEMPLFEQKEDCKLQIENCGATDFGELSRVELAEVKLQIQNCKLRMERNQQSCRWVYAGKYLGALSVVQF